MISDNINYLILRTDMLVDVFHALLCQFLKTSYALFLYRTYQIA